MKEKELIDIWKREESVAHIHGWDFSHIEGRYTEETDLPWNYQNIILDYLKPEMKLLDIDTGGGEFLLSLRHPYVKTSATEAYPPNIQLCKETLLPLGIDFRAGDGKDMLPFDDYEFDIEMVKEDCIGIGLDMGLALDSSLTPSNSTWWKPVTASQNNQGEALKQSLERYITFHTVENLGAYGIDEITAFNIYCEARGNGSYSIYFLFA